MSCSLRAEEVWFKFRVGEWNGSSFSSDCADENHTYLELN